MKIIITIIMLIQLAQALTIEEKLKQIATLEVKDGDLELKMKGRMIYQEDDKHSNDLVQTKAGQIIVLRKGFSEVRFIVRDYSIALVVKNKEKQMYVLIEKIVNGATGLLIEHHIEFKIHDEIIETTSGEIVYTEKEILNKIETDRKKLKADLAKETIKDKLKNIASSVSVEKGNILLTIKKYEANDFSYDKSTNGRRIPYELEVGQKIVLEKGFDEAFFNGLYYAIELKKKGDHYLLEEWKAEKPAKSASKVKTFLKFKILDDRFEIIPEGLSIDEKKESEKTSTFKWITLILTILFMSVFVLVLYKKRKSSNE